jgi:4-hydroxybenzoate polyprenyltransferase
VLSVLLIAAGGYIINDYFDIRIDQVNRGEKVVLGNKIPVRHAIPLHATFTASGVVLGAFTAFMVGNIKLVFIHLLAGLLLWLYSARYKRKPVWGNLVVAIVSALVVAIVWLFEVFAMSNNNMVILNRSEWVWMNHTILFMAGFAFVFTIIREMIKDMEDLEGDRRYGCLTLPVVVGVPTVKWVVGVLTGLSMAVLLWVQFHLAAGLFHLVAWYFIVIQFMMGFLIVKLWKAHEKDDFNALSQLARIIMLAGILSMQVYHLQA